MLQGAIWGLLLIAATIGYKTALPHLGCGQLCTKCFNFIFSVEEDNCPQWRKLAWSQDCSMLALSYRWIKIFLLRTFSYDNNHPHTSL